MRLQRNRKKDHEPDWNTRDMKNQRMMKQKNRTTKTKTRGPDFNRRGL